MSANPRINVLLGAHPLIRWDNGDRINELRFMTVLSQFADVHYNGVPFSPGDLSAGTSEGIVPHSPGAYDLVYVRGNPEAFLAAEGPGLYLGLPYDADCFRKASAVATTTQYWKVLMEGFPAVREGLGLEAYYDVDTFVAPRHIINIEQSIDPRFTPQCRSHALTDDYRVRLGWGFNVAYMGRLHDNSLPYDLLDAVPELRRRHPDLRVVLAGPSKVDLAGRGVTYIGLIPYGRMRFAISACDMMVYDHDSTGEWLGAGKVLDALACDVPILCRRHEARVEQLGEDYPLFFSNREELVDRVNTYRQSEAFRRSCHAHMARRREHYQPQTVASRLEPQIRALL